MIMFVMLPDFGAADFNQAEEAVHHTPSGEPTRRYRQKMETRRLIREAAYDLFEARGYEKTTMRQLASRAGVGLGTIFQHFPDKASLLAACFREDLLQLTDSALADLPRTGLRDQLLHLVRHFFTFYARRPHLFRVLLQGIMFQHTEAAARIELDLLAFLERVAALAEEARRRGELAPKVNPQLLASAFWAFYGLSLSMGLRGDDFDVTAQTEMVGLLLDQHLAGCAKGSGSQAERVSHG